MEQKKIPITVAYGDGIGPEIMEACLMVLKEAGANLDIHSVDIGEKVYLQGYPAGIAPETWETIRGTKAFLKAPITTPQGGGFRSLNVTIRTTLGLYANVRPCVSYHPFVDTKHPEMDVVIVRENEEDLYVGIEYQQTQDTVHALKVITRPGCEKIIRYAFEYARSYQRKKVTCFTKDNILKRSDGLFHKIFQEIAHEYPDIENEHWIIDIGAAKLADSPELFDVVVMPNLYGDILSDVAAQITGSVGLAGSANIGAHGAMFEAIHGSAPKYAGKNSANPTGLLLGSVMMLVHIGLPEVAERVHNALLKTIEDGIHTRDIYEEGVSKKEVGTKEYAKAIAERLGQKPEVLKEVHYSAPKILKSKAQKRTSTKKETIGVDIYIEHLGDVDSLQTKISPLAGPDLQLTMIANRGVVVWPHWLPETLCSDTWRCRFKAKQPGKKISKSQIAHLIQKLANESVEFVQIEILNTFDGQPGFSLTQDEQ